MSRGQSDNRRAVRGINRRPILRNDGTEKFTGNVIPMKAFYGNPEYFGSNINRKKKKNMLVVSFSTKNRHKRNEKN